MDHTLPCPLKDNCPNEIRENIFSHLDAHSRRSLLRTGSEFGHLTDTHRWMMMEEFFSDPVFATFMPYAQERVEKHQRIKVALRRAAGSLKIMHISIEYQTTEGGLAWLEELGRFLKLCFPSVRASCCRKSIHSFQARLQAKVSSSPRRRHYVFIPELSFVPRGTENRLARCWRACCDCIQRSYRGRYRSDCCSNPFAQIQHTSALRSVKQSRDEDNFRTHGRRLP